MSDVERKLAGLKKLLKMGLFDYSEIMEQLGVDYAYARKLVQLLRDQGVPVEAKYYKGKKQFYIPPVDPDPKQALYDLKIPVKDGKYSFGVIACTHIGSEFTYEEFLHDFYDILEQRNIKVVLHGGDLFEGVKGSSRPGQLNELKVYGYRKMLDYGVDVYPQRKGIKTYVITGNHDDWYWNLAGANIVKHFAELRKDVEYLGMQYADLKINGNSVVIQHGGGSPNTYAKSYRLQKYLDGMRIRPNFYFLAHYHKSNYMPYNGTHAFLLGTFKDGDLYGKSIPGGADVGGWIVTVNVDKKKDILSVVPEWVGLP